VRTSDATKLAPLSALSSLGELDIISGCDLLSTGSFDAAVAASDVCFHTASPFWMDSRITDPWAQLVHPAERGTLNVLDACTKAASQVKRVVLTSSFASLMNVGGRTPWPMDFHYSEEHWNVSSAPDGDGAFPEPVNAHAYRWSKTAAEKAAWAHPAVTGGQLELVTILPPMVLGENKQVLRAVSDLNQSSLLLFNMLAGKMEHVPPGSVGFVDVADVARAHVLGAEVAAAGGERYLCSGSTKTWLEVVAMLKRLFPDAPLPTTCADGSTVQPCLLLKNDKIKTELGIEFTPLEQTLKAQCDALTRSGLLSL
jgi:nucleoside-diphosphate-sugar epimerase